MMAGKIVTILFLWALFSNSYSADVHPLPTPVSYMLDLKIDYKTKKLYGHCVVLISNETDQPIENLPFLLYRLLSVRNVKNENHPSLPFTQKVVSITGWEQIQVNCIDISLGDPLLPGQKSTIELDYEGYLFGYSADGWRYVKDHIDRNFTMIRTDGFGYPVIAYPDEKEMTPFQVKYDYSIRVTVPDGLTVATGGRLLAETKTGDETTFVFSSRVPSWRMDIAISDFRSFEEGKNKVYYFATDSLGAQKVIHAMQSSFELFTGWFGPLDQYAGYMVLEVPEGYGSQQDVAAIILSADNFNVSKDMNTIYHEIAHSWNVKNLDPRPCRFESEGFARFLEFLLLERIDKKENVVSETAQRYMERIRTSFNENKEYQNVPMNDYGVEDMTDFSYSLGMVVFTIFYELTGEEIFNKIIGSFYSQYHSTGATTEEFIDHCIALTSQNLDLFFDDWIYTTNGVEMIMEGKSLQELIQFYKDHTTPGSTKGDRYVLVR